MVGHGFHFCLDHMDPLLEWLPLHRGFQTILPDGFDLELFKEEILYIVKVEKFANQSTIKRSKLSPSI